MKRERETIFLANDYQGINDGGDAFTIVSGSNNVMISVPHSVRHKRDGQLKLPEINTGSFGLDLQSQTNSHLIYKKYTDDEDPNYSQTSLYRQSLVEYIKDNHIEFLIDIHGTKDSKYDFIIGTNRQLNVSNNSLFIKFVKEFFENKNYSIAFDYRFFASKNTTISKTVHSETNIYALQMELSQKLRLNKENYNNFLNDMSEFVELLKYKTIYKLDLFNIIGDNFTNKIGIDLNRKNVSFKEGDFVNSGNSNILNENSYQIMINNFGKPNVNYVTRSLKTLKPYFTKISSKHIGYIFKQPIQYLNKNIVGVDEETYHWLKSFNTNYVMVYNNLTKANIVLQYVLIDKKTKPSVWLNFRIREMLELSPQEFYSVENYEHLLSYYKESEPKLYQFFSKCYLRNDKVNLMTLKEDVDLTNIFNEDDQIDSIEDVRRLIRKSTQLTILPSTKSIKDKLYLFDFLVGHSSTKLKVQNALLMDEETNIVRISENTAKILDINEKEKLILRRLSKERSCRVLIDNKIGDYSISVPKSIANYLGVSRGTIVDVARDSRFIVVTKLDSIILTVVVTYFSMIQTISVFKINDKIWFIPIISIFILVFVLIVISTFSERRNNVK